MKNDICMGCMSQKGNVAVCPRCGYDENTPRTLPALKPGTVLDNRYMVGAARKITGEGVTYIALDKSSGRKVILREFLPTTLAVRGKNSNTVQVRENCDVTYRDYLSDFLDVSRAVSRLSDVQAIAPVLDIFEDNNTAYAVYEFVNGRTLSELVSRAKRLTWEEARPLFLSLISAMSAAHSIGLVHFGLSPESIMIKRDGNLVITDFGIPDSRIAETELKPELNEGFSALEQYSMENKKGKWTDVYSMCAVMLFALTGKRLPGAQSRAVNPKLNVPGSLAETIPTHVLTAIAGGLQVNGNQRTPSMDKLKAELTQSSGGSRVSGVGSVVSSAASKVGSFASGLVNNRRPAQKSTVVDSDGEPIPWFRRLSQFQYALLSTGISVVVLGGIALTLFLAVVRPALHKDDKVGPTVVDHGVSASDMSLDGEIVPVPNLRGVSLADAQHLPDYLKFQIIEKDEAYSDDYDVGVIISQSIKPDEQVYAGTPIGVTVSLGSEKCRIPNIIGMTVYDADDALIEAGLRLGSQTEEYSDSVPEGCIISISGAEIGSRMTRGSAVNVVVSRGAE